jgi:hypothetical protein
MPHGLRDLFLSGMIPPTEDATTGDQTLIDGALGQFNVLSNSFRHHYSDLPDGHIRILVIKKRNTEDFDEPSVNKKYSRYSYYS